MQIGIIRIESNNEFARVREGKRDFTSLSESILPCACSSEAGAPCLCFVQHQALARPSHLKGQGQDAEEEGKAGRGPQPPTAGVMEDSVKWRATPAAVGKGSDGRGDNTAANWGGGKE